MKHTIKGYLIWRVWKGEPMHTGEVHFSPYEPDSSGTCWDEALIREHSFEVEVPEDFDPTPGLIKSLQAQKAVLTAEFTKSVAAINAQISQLQAIEYTPSSEEAEPTRDPFELESDFEHRLNAWHNERNGSAA